MVGIATGPCERLLVGFTWIDDRRIECPAVVGTDSAGLRARVRPGHHVTHLRPPTWRCWRHSAGQRAPPDPQDSIRTTKAGTRVGPQRYPDLMAEDQVLERKVPGRANRSPEGMKSQPKQLEHPPGWHPPSTRIASSRRFNLACPLMPPPWWPHDERLPVRLPVSQVARAGGDQAPTIKLVLENLAELER